MATLLRDQFPLLWSPNQDEINGDPRGLLRADNLTLEEDGVLSLIRGTKKLSLGPFSGVTQLYSKTMNLADISGDGAYSTNAKVRYAVDGGNVIRNWSPTNKEEASFDLGITSGQVPGTLAGFGFGFGHVWITHGNDKKKDDGIKQTDIGIPAPAGFPTATANAGPILYLSQGSSAADDDYTKWEALENKDTFVAGADYCEIDADETLLFASAIRGLSQGLNIDGMALGGVADTGTENDIFSMTVRIAETQKFVKVSITFYLLDPTSAGIVSDATDYYYFEWSPFNYVFNQGVNQWSTVECLRSEFQRVGTTETLNWKDIRGIKVVFINSTHSEQSFVFNQMKFKGGTKGPLTGQYTYVQVDVNNNGSFVEKSRGSASSNIVEPNKSSVTVNPITVQPEANEVWIYRIGVGLSQYYRVKVLTGAAGFDPPAFEDTMTDEEALLLNIPLDMFQTLLPDGIISMECNWKGRNWYLTESALYPSYRDMPSAYDSRYVLENADKNVEINLFITRINSDELIIATTGDFYSVTGTGGILTQDNIDFFDITIRPLGIKSPAVTHCYYVYEGNLFYTAADGIRMLAGSNCQLLSAAIDLMFKGYTRFGIAPLKHVHHLSERCYLGVRKNRLYFSMAQTDNKRCLYVYNFEDKNWRYEEHGDADSIMALWIEDDDTLIYSTASFGDRFLRQLDIGTKFDEVNDINFNFRTTFDCNAQPRNRKDSFTLKLLIETGGKDVTLNLRGFEGLTSGISNETKIFTKIFKASGEIQWPIFTEISPVKYYQLEIYGASDKFKFWNWSIDYEPRPEQVSYLRIPPAQFGIAGRKRLQEIPFVIDTLGNEIDFTPILDGTPATKSTHVTNDKALRNHLFIADISAFDVGAILSSTTGGIFEFYELIQPREIEQLPDPVRYKWVPYTNFGSAARKRFIQYAFVIDTRGLDVTMTPYVDGAAKTPKIFNTDRKRTVIYTFDYFAAGVDIAASFFGAQPFEFYELNLNECITEKLPPIARFYHIPYTNFNTSSRKRVRQYAFTIDTFNNMVEFIPYVDGTAYPPMRFATARKHTVIYTFDDFVAGIDIGGTLQGLTQDFEFYGVNLEECVYEKLPPIASHLHIAYTNFNTSSRKRFKQFAFVIDTFGKQVTFTPYIDGRVYISKGFATSRKETVIHTFIAEPEAIGVDIGGLLESPSNEDFEFYGLNLEDSAYEKLPAKARSLEIACTNFGSASRKRIRTIPFVINTFGSSVKFTPTIDGVPFPPSYHITTEKRTVLHYFECDHNGVPFGIDYCGALEGVNEFEYYEMLKPEIVEFLPVGKKFDQFGPIEFSKVGKIKEVSVRMINTGNVFSFVMYASDVKMFTGSVLTNPNMERTYVIPCPKGVNPNIFRMELCSDTVFHRFDCAVKLHVDGAETEMRWVKLKDAGFKVN